MSDTEKDWSVWVEVLFDSRDKRFTGTEAEARKARDEIAAQYDKLDDIFLCHGAEVIEKTNGLKPVASTLYAPTEPEPPDTQHKMTIRDAHKTDGPVQKYNPESGIAILADDGLPLWTIKLNPNGTLVIKCGSGCEHDGKVIADSIQIEPVAANYLLLQRPALVFPPAPSSK